MPTRKASRITMLCLCFCIAARLAFGQNMEAAVWSSGRVIMDFRGGVLKLDTTSLLLPAIGSLGANICDASGKYLFHLGASMANRHFRPMPNGNMLNFGGFVGTSTDSQTWVILRHPGNPFQYYMIIVEVFDVQASLIDMRLDSGRGAVLSTYGRVPFITISSAAISRLTVMQHANNRDYWLLYRKFLPFGYATNDTVYARLVSPEGISQTEVKTKVQKYANYFRYHDQAGSPDSERFAFIGFQKDTFRLGDLPTVRLYRFNRATGQLYSEVTWPFPQASVGIIDPNAPVLGRIAFTATGRHLYAAQQVRILPNPLQVRHYKWPVWREDADSIGRYGGLLTRYALANGPSSSDYRVAIDGQMYFTNGGISLYRIDCADADGLDNTFTEIRRFRRPGSTVELLSHLPFHSQTFLVNAYKLQAQAERPFACLGDTVRLLAYGAGLSRFQWFNQAGQAIDTTASIYVVASSDSLFYKVRGIGPCGQQDSATVWVRAVPRPPIPVVQVSRQCLCDGDTAILTAPSGYRSYLWYPWDTTQSIRVRKPGWYRVEVSNGVGCTSVSEPVRIDTSAGVRPSKPILSHSDTNLCVGQTLNLSVLNAGGNNINWFTGDTTQTITVTQTGRYEVRLRTPLGCESDSAAGINVTVNPLPRAQTLASGNNDSTVCFSGQAISLGNAPEPNTSYTWSATSPGTTDSLSNVQISNPTLRYLNTDSVSSTFYLSLFTFHQPTGCFNSDSLRLTFVPFLRPNAGADQSHCPGQTANLGLKGFSTFTYRWNPETGLASPNQATTSGSLTNTTQTPISQTYIRTVSLLGCTASDTVQLTALPKPPGLQISGPQFVCPGVTNVPYQISPKEQVQSIQVKILGGDSTRFEEGILYVNWGAANPNGQITLIPVNNFGCKGDSTLLPINITRELRPQTTLILGINDSLCLSNAQNLPYGIVNHNPQSRYSWRTEPPESQQSASQADSVRISYLAPDSFQLILHESDTTPIAQCIGESLYFVRIWPQPQPQQIQGFDSLCIGESKLQVISTKDKGGFVWSASLGNIEPITPNQSEVNYTANFTPGQDFTPVILTASETSDKGCTGPQNEKTLTIETLPNPQIPRIENSLNWQSLDNNSYSAIGRPGSTFTWQVENGQITAGQGSDQITVNWLPDQQPYGLTVTETTPIGCQSQAISQSIAYDKTLFISNVITPNADGDNDLFEIKNLSFYPNSSLSIYNRWGKEVFRTDNYQNNWQTNEAGTYFFVLTVEGKVWKGMVSVVK